MARSHLCHRNSTSHKRPPAGAGSKAKGWALDGTSLPESLVERTGQRPFVPNAQPQSLEYEPKLCSVLTCSRKGILGNNAPRWFSEEQMGERATFVALGRERRRKAPVHDSVMPITSNQVACSSAKCWIRSGPSI